MQNTEGGFDALLAPVPYAGEAPRAEGRRTKILKPEGERAAGDSRTPRPKPVAGRPALSTPGWHGTHIQRHLGEGLIGPSPLQSLQDDCVSPLGVEPDRALGVSHWEGGEGQLRYAERWLPLIAVPCNGHAAEGTPGDASVFLLAVIGSTGMSPDLHNHEAESGLKDCQFLIYLL